LRVTRDAYREQAEYWFGSRDDFTSKPDQLSHELMQRVLDALADLAITAKGYSPAIDANDCGRCIIFWNEGQPVTVFVPSHPTACQPPKACILAFDRLWSIATEPV
jgi:hypothetical protein